MSGGAGAAELRGPGRPDNQVGELEAELGAPESAPYDAILVTAVAPSIPDVLVRQLRMGGRMVVPVGRHEDDQELLVVTRTEDGTDIESLGGVRFVPLRGAGGFEDDRASVL